MSDDKPTPGPWAEPSESRSAIEPEGGGGPPSDTASASKGERPPYRAPLWFLAVVSIASLALDLGTKAWVSSTLADAAGGRRRIEVIEDHLWLTFAKNPGGAWGLLQGESESVRKPFFLLVSVVAIGFIFSLYRKLAPGQTALRWGLPLVLGGALGNLADRLRYGYVVDFIDYRADWVRAVNGLIGRFSGERGLASDHWPTFNIADIAIVLGVALMAVDMFQSRQKGPVERRADDAEPPDPPPGGGAKTELRMRGGSGGVGPDDPASERV